MTTLIERLEALDGPDREADAEIRRAVFPEHVAKFRRLVIREAMRHNLSVKPLLVGNPFPPDRLVNLVAHVDWQERESSPCYTASIDAALTLNPDWYWELGCHADPGKLYIALLRGPEDRKRDEGQYSVGEANTPAIALCIAALKAREQSDAP